MSFIRAVLSALGIAGRRTRFEEGMADELRFHIGARADDLVAQGMRRDEAVRCARLELGNTEPLKEDMRDARGQRFFDEFGQDIRYARRRFFRSRGPLIVAVFALGIGVNLAIFSVIHAALIRPLPHPEPDRLIAISSRSIQLGRPHQMAPLDFFDLERRATTVARMAAYYPPGFTLTGAGEAERISGARASSGIFDVFGVRPALGRGFLAEEDRPNAPPVAVLSHNLWARVFSADPKVIGKAVTLSGRAYTVVGVLPEDFYAPAMWPRMPEVWVPIGLDPNVGRRNARMLRVLGRMHPGFTVAQASVELDAIAASLAAEHPDTNTGTGAGAAGLLDELTRDVRPSLYALAAAVLALLLVACGNAAGLLFGAAFERRPEFAIRLAIGASRGRIIRQLVAESSLIGALAAIAGFVLALYSADFLIGVATAAGVPRAQDITVGWPMFAIGVLLAVACTTGSALIAALEATRFRDLRVVRGSGTTSTRTRTRAVLIGLQAAFSLALLIGSGLLVRSFYELQFTRPGFDTHSLLTARLSAPQARYPAGPALAGFYDRALERVRGVPGVDAASVVDWLPVSGFGASIGFSLPANASSPRSSELMAELRVIGADYFETLRIPVVAGRTFDRRDVAGAPLAVTVNESFARAHFDGINPVGQHLTLNRGGPLEGEIVGVVGDVREIALRLAPSPTVYAPRTQEPWMRHETRDLVVRTTVDAAVVIPAIQTVLRQLEPDMARPTVQPIDDVIAGALARPGFYAAAVTLFALTGVLLAAFGIYGTVTSAVGERRAELGVRLALGASRPNVLIRAARYGVGPTVLGLAAGIPLAFGAGYLVRQQLYGVTAFDWPTTIAATVFMGIVAVVAAMTPAIHASRIDPADVLRHEDAR